MNTEQAKQLLIDLGSSSRKVAATLKAEGIKGKKKTATYCPVSMYLKKHGATRVSTSMGTAVLLTAEVTSVEQWEFIVLPTAVNKFVVSFDQGRYPALENK